MLSTITGRTPPISAETRYRSIRLELEAGLVERRDDEDLVDVRRDDVLTMAVTARDHAAA